MTKAVQQFRALIAAHAAVFARSKSLVTRRPCPVPTDAEIDWALEPLIQYQSEFTPFGDWPVIGWPISLIEWLTKVAARALLIPVVGVKNSWPTFNIPGRGR
ncbi:hypothetical protein [Sphingomonas sp.]|uniref:hypothetical protein n=1 Tax=Sphingomonas sp. TaxID=28214 RepID=UPI002FDA88BC